MYIMYCILTHFANIYWDIQLFKTGVLLFVYYISLDIPTNAIQHLIFQGNTFLRVTHHVSLCFQVEYDLIGTCKTKEGENTTDKNISIRNESDITCIV